MTTPLSPAHEQQALSDPPMVASVSQELINVLQKIVENAGALLEVNNCSVALLDVKASALVTLAALHKTPYTPRNTRFQMKEGVAGWVAEHREALIINDVSLDARFKKLGRQPVGSIACIPLMDRDVFIGTLTVSSPERDAFDERKERILHIFADQATLAISNARQAEIAQRQASQLEMLLRLSQGITTHRETEELYRAILVHIHRLVPSTRTVIYAYHEQLQELYPVAQHTHPTIHVGNVPGEAIRLHHSTSLVAWAALHQHPMIHTPIKFHQDERCMPVEEALVAEMAVPLVSKDIIYGVLELQRAEAYSSEELRLVRNLSDMAAAALENIALLQRVRTDQEQWRAIWNTSSDGIALLDIGACFIEANPAFGNIFGSDPQQMTGMEWLELFGCSEEEAQRDCPEMLVIALALREQRSLPYVEVELLVKGAMRAIGLSVTPVTLTNTPFSLVMARDITPIREAARMKANFLSMITHELRSPINTINGYLDLTLTGIAGELNEQQREFLQRARSGSENLYALVEDLLLVSRADAGQLRLNRSVLHLPEIIANSVEEMELTAKDKHITLDVAISDDFPRLYADGVRLQQVLRNLLNNALHYTSAGGQVTVVARAVDMAGRAEDAGATQEDAADDVPRMALIEVSDTGIGIAAEQHERIFERFYQVPLDSAGRASGQGLGLAIVKMIVELHGGQVRVTSAPGEGSTFAFTIPGILS